MLTFGQRAVSAGDVNGDGFADILVSAPFYDGGSIDTGQVNLYFGSTDGLNFHHRLEHHGQ